MNTPRCTFQHIGYVPGHGFEGRLWDADRYAEYLRSVQGRMPAGAAAYAGAGWHYDPNDPRCPHDAWIEFITMQESTSGRRFWVGELNIKARALGAYHDGHFEISYSSVASHCLERQASSSSFGGYGDWLTDEVRLSESGKVIHEILFVGGRWIIECDDLRYEWIPLDSPCLYCTAFAPR